MNNIFNTSFEVGLRILLLLHTVAPDGITIDRIAAYDFITIYAKNFNLSEFNLHGNSNYNFSEFSNKRAMCKSVLKELALDGSIKIESSSSGFIYKISSPGTQLANNLSSDYATEYAKIAKKTHQTYKNKSDESITSDINKLALKKLRR